MDYLTLFAALIAFAIGLGVGRIHQRLLDGIRIRALELQCKELAEIDDDDDDWDDDPDNPEYVARVEDTLRNWGPIE